MAAVTPEEYHRVGRIVYARRARLEALAEQMRGRTPEPPAGFDPETHRLLLARRDDVERWSLDDVESRIPR